MGVVLFFYLLYSYWLTAVDVESTFLDRLDHEEQGAFN